jgi:hypothetical protein
VPRQAVAPTVVPELFASLMPKTYEGSMERDNKELADLPPIQESAPAERKLKEQNRLGKLRASGAIAKDDGSRPDDGSSSTSRSGRCARAATKLTRARCPFERLRSRL